MVDQHVYNRQPFALFFLPVKSLAPVKALLPVKALSPVKAFRLAILCILFVCFFMKKKYNKARLSVDLGWRESMQTIFSLTSKVFYIKVIHNCPCIVINGECRYQNISNKTIYTGIVIANSHRVEYEREWR